MLRRRWIAAAAAALASAALGQQVPDRHYQPDVARPQYARGKGPVVCIDAAHFNFHTLQGGFFAFAQLLRADGFRLRANRRKFDAAALTRCRVLVVANAQPSDQEWDDYPRPTPSAFTEAEIAAVRAWVARGGALLLIADHMPLAGAAAKMAAAFEVEFVDGFARREPKSADPDLFLAANGSLRDHPITRGREGEAVSQLRTFTGQAFRAPQAEPLLVFPAGYVQLLPIKAWDFTPETPRMPVEGWLQGAVQQVGEGRAAFFGEAAMFTAQLSGEERRPVGMSAPGAGQNFRFALNLLHWLTGSL